MGRKIIAFIVCGSIIVFLFLFAKYLYCQEWFRSIKLSNELIPLDVINIIVSSSVAVYIAWYISKKLTAVRYEKEYLIKDLQQIDNEVFNLSSCVTESSQIPIADILVKLNKIKVVIDRFQRTVLLVQLSAIKLFPINSSYLDLYQSMTDIDGYMLEFTPEKKNEIQKYVSDLAYHIRKTIFQINKI